MAEGISGALALKGRTAELGGEQELALIVRARAGDTTAFDNLYCRYRDKIFTLCLNFCGDHEEAADLLQETFVRAWRGLPRFAGRAAFATWLFRIAINSCREAARRRRRPPETLEETAAPENDLMLVDQVRRTLVSLRPAHRMVLVLHYSGSLSCQEIADCLGWSLSRVKVTLHRARKAFKEIYLREQEAKDEVG